MNHGIRISTEQSKQALHSITGKHFELVVSALLPCFLATGQSYCCLISLAAQTGGLAATLSTDCSDHMYIVTKDEACTGSYPDY